jgi:hypothetical protein
MKYLATLPSGTAEVAAVKQHVPNFIELTPDDKEPSGTRPNEAVWQQVVGNIVSHRHESPENFINRGLLAYDSGDSCSRAVLDRCEVTGSPWHRHLRRALRVDPGAICFRDGR